MGCKYLLKHIDVDAFINVRLMMEMNSTAIEEYFGAIQDTLRENDLFDCINRCIKTMLTRSNNREINRIGDYPFDDCWPPLYSCLSHIHPYIYVLIAKREREKLKCPSKNLLRTVRPNAYFRK